MSVGGVLRSVGLVACLFALTGIVVSVLAAWVGPGGTLEVNAVLVLAVGLALAGALIVVIAVAIYWWLQERIPDRERRHAVATMGASGTVLLSGLMSVQSLGLLALAITAVMALLTHLVLQRTLR